MMDGRSCRESGTLAAMAGLLHGVDIVDIDRIGDLVQSHGDRFVTRVFTEPERRYAESSRPGRLERYAARFAAKEAVFKALGCGWAGGTAWTDVSVSHREGGGPEVSVAGHTATLAAAKGVQRWEISLSHAGGLAMASVIGVQGDAVDG